MKSNNFVSDNATKHPPTPLCGKATGFSSGKQRKYPTGFVKMESDFTKILFNAVVNKVSLPHFKHYHTPPPCVPQEANRLNP